MYALVIANRKFMTREDEISVELFLEMIKAKDRFLEITGFPYDIVCGQCENDSDIMDFDFPDRENYTTLEEIVDEFYESEYINSTIIEVSINVEEFIRGLEYLKEKNQNKEGIL